MRASTLFAAAILACAAALSGCASPKLASQNTYQPPLASAPAPNQQGLIAYIDETQQSFVKPAYRLMKDAYAAESRGQGEVALTSAVTAHKLYLTPGVYRFDAAVKRAGNPPSGSQVESLLLVQGRDLNALLDAYYNLVSNRLANPPPRRTGRYLPMV
ncbi:MAG: hypothetical protein COY40_02435 [Alphaproteobacteria bacterium CG_4_10_14_0_8_um_filter_53_9]|nr:MAG: hypothetical protein COY40_02435 [Alphaproteobacteria bacterium CG_4_10_14_0_8_um_filter_53_9]